MAAAAAAADGGGRRTKRRRRRRGVRWSKTPRRSPPPQPPSASSSPPAPDSSSPSPSSSPPARDPLPPGAEVEVRVDGPGYHGSWFEATVVGFSPARGRRYPARYAVTYEHLLADEDGGVLEEYFAPTHIRPRPPPPASPPQFSAHDIVEAFHNDGWWSGIVNSSAPATPRGGAAATVTVAFPITREVIQFAPRHVRPRRDYEDGEWVPSRAAMVVRPKRALRVYVVGDKVEVGRARPRYGYSWFPATVSRVIDDLSYVVEYWDLEEEGDAGPEKATEYLHWRFIRPAVEHVPRESEFQLGCGAAVEAYCDGAWSLGVVRRAVGDGEFEVSVAGKKTDLLVTKGEEFLKPQYKWNGKQWKIVAAKRHANLRLRSMLGQNLSSPVEVSSSGDDYSHDPESAGTKKSRKKFQQLDVESAKRSEHDTPLSTLCKSPESNQSGSRLTAMNSLQVTSHGVVSSVPMNGHLCASPCASPGHSTPQNESIPNSTGEIVDGQEILSEKMGSNGHLNKHVYGPSADDAHDMLSIAELRKKMISARGSSSNRQVLKKVLSAKTLKVKKGISKSERGSTHPIQELQGENDASDNIQLKGNISISSQVIVCALSASVEGQTTKTPDRRVTRQTHTGSSPKVLTYKKLAKKKGARELFSLLSSVDVTTVQQGGRKKMAGPIKESLVAEQIEQTLEDTMDITDLSDQDMVPRIPPGFESMYDGTAVDIHGSLLDEEPPAMINSISQANINADLCTDGAATQVAKSNHLMETATLSVDHIVQLAGAKVDERSIVSRLLNAGSSECTLDNSPLRSCSASGSSMPSHMPVSQGDQALFVKSSSLLSLLEASDAFKMVPQRPHFLPLRQYPLSLREGMAIGMMSSYCDIVKHTMKASIDHDAEWFEEKIHSLSHLEENGFDVQFLQSTLTELLQMKSDGTSYLGEIQTLDSQIVNKIASSSQIDALLDEKDRGIAELEQKLGRLRQESQKIAKYKEQEDAELFGLQSERSRFKEAYHDVKRQFHNTVAELHGKKLT